MKNLIKDRLIHLNLQAFADGDNAGGNESTIGNENGQNTGAPGLQNSDTDVAKAGFDQANEQTHPEEDRKALFEKAYAEYKDLFDEKTQKAVKSRVKNLKEYEDKYNKLQPVMEMLSQRYGVSVDDVEGIVNSIENDNVYYEEEALERGISVEELKTIKEIERQNMSMQRKLDEYEAREKAQRLVESWGVQAEETKKYYPEFDFRAELENPRFLQFLQMDVPVKAAYEVMHLDDIIPAAMQYAAKETESRMVNNIIANGNRPVENGIKGQAPSKTKKSVWDMTDEEMEDIVKRVKSGERVVL